MYKILRQGIQYLFSYSMVCTVQRSGLCTPHDPPHVGIYFLEPRSTILRWPKYEGAHWGWYIISNSLNDQKFMLKWHAKVYKGLIVSRGAVNDCMGRSSPQWVLQFSLYNHTNPCCRCRAMACASSALKWLKIDEICATVNVVANSNNHKFDCI